jgi:tetratricopeptide (TPR) repeat protein
LFLLWSRSISQESIRVTLGYLRKLGPSVAVCLLAVITAQAQTGMCILQGHVRDSDGKLVRDASVLLQRMPETATTGGESQTAHTDSAGAFHFSGLREGTYSLRAEVKAGGPATPDSVATLSSLTLARNETKSIELVLRSISSEPRDTGPSKTQSASPASSQQLQLFDEPQFTVAGITQATNSGGHGSANVLRSSEALVKATVSLGNEAQATESAKASDISDSAQTSKLKQERTNLQAQLLPESNISGDKPRDDHSRQQQSDLHHLLAQVDEKLDDPLAAVREYQRAAELTPSERNLFDWASELLSHRALEPATEVFIQGNRLYPTSVRMLIGLGVAWYARGSYDRAAQYLGSASDLAPGDETPYLFMGRMQSEETVPSQETLERLARFQHLEPGNAWASYYYAVSLWKWKRSAGALDDTSSAQIETLLQKAIQLDPKLGAAHLQLGILYAQRGDYAHAILAYQKAIEVSPELEETHYRLAQAYKRNGDAARAQKELQLHEQLSKQAKEKAERERAEIQEFVITLRDK